MFHQIILSILLGPAVGLAAHPGVQQEQLPYHEQITKILSTLEYSGLWDIIKPEVSLSLEFDKRMWRLRNIHQYDEQGGIILEKGRYGLCAELSTYLYQQLKEFLPAERFELKFAMGTEPGFFPTYESNHIILLMIDRGSRTSYLLDPSFHRYGPISEFSQYGIKGIRDALEFVKDKSLDVSFDVDQAMPLLIKDDLLLSFAVTSLDGNFDKDNFMLVVSAHRKDVPSAVNVIAVGKHKGKIESFESDDLLGKFLNRKEVNDLHKSLSAWLVGSNN